MNICGGQLHDEVCYEGRTCPMCALQEELGAKIENLQTENLTLKTENEDLTKECENYQQMIDAEPQERP